MNAIRRRCQLVLWAILILVFLVATGCSTTAVALEEIVSIDPNEVSSKDDSSGDQPTEITTTRDELPEVQPEERALREQTVGLFLNEPSAFDGYTLFAPNFSEYTYLIDMDGYVVNIWESDYRPGQSAYLLENGNLLRTVHLSDIGGGPSGGGIQEIAWDGTIVWDFQYANLAESRLVKQAAENTIFLTNLLGAASDHLDWFSAEESLPHHDIEPMPNGNVLILAWEFKTEAEAIAAGRNPRWISEGELWPEMIIEVQPTGPTSGKIVWEWHLWDHLIQDYDPSQANYGVVADHPELIDLNYAGKKKADWIHANAIDYNPELDQIIISCRSFNELWIIDHSTTTEEAAGHTGGKSGKGGDILYRWGNPQAFDNGSKDDQTLFGQHDTQWIEPGLPGDGNILIFNNGNHRPAGEYSSVDEIVPPLDANGHYLITPNSAQEPQDSIWSYVAPNPSDFYADKVSGAQRLPNGNTLVCSGTNGTIFEVTPEGEIVWLYVNPVTSNGPLSQGDSIPGDNKGFANAVFRAYRYAPDYPGLAGKDLTPGKPIEQ